MKWYRWWIAGLVVLLVGVTGLFWLTTRRPAPGAVRPVLRPPGRPEVAGTPHAAGELVLHGTVEPAQRQTVVAPAAGTVVAWLQGPGNPVGEGQPLLQISNPQRQAQLKAAQAKLARAQREQAQAQQQTATLAELTEAENMLRDARLKVETTDRELAQFAGAHAAAQNALERYQEAVANAERVEAAYLKAKAAHEQALRTPPNLADEQAMARTSRIAQHFRAMQVQQDLAQNQLAEARKLRDRYPNEVEQLQTLRRVVADARRRVQQLEPRVKRLRARQDRLTQARLGAALQPAQAALAAAEAAVAALQVCAPRSGLLREMTVRPGDKVTAGQKLATIELAGGARFVLRAQTSDRPRLHVGQDLLLEAGEGVARPARVTQIDDQSRPLRVYVAPLDDAAAPAPGTALLGRFPRR